MRFFVLVMEFDSILCHYRKIIAIKMLQIHISIQLNIEISY